ncbi:MAG: DedA family protein [Polyangiales bacterium]
MKDWLFHFVSAHGYWAVGVLVGLESMGIPMPGETALVLAAVFAGTTGRLSIGWVIIAASLGAILGDNVGYLIGHSGGFPLLRRWGPKLRIDDKKLKLGVWLFRKYGGPVVFFGRFVAVLRTWAAFLAGTNRMNWRKFLLYNAAGGIVWSAVFGFLGYQLGDRVHLITGWVARGGVVVGVAAIVAGMLFFRRHAKALEARAEREMPGAIEEWVQ